MRVVYVIFLLFFIHLFTLNFFFSKLCLSVPKNNGMTGEALLFMISYFFAFVLFILTLILMFIEYKMDFDYKNIMLFLVYSNCFLMFYLANLKHNLFSNTHDCFDLSSKIIISLYFIFELFITHYIVSNKIYKSEQ
jgi:hypothetical protein